MTEQSDAREVLIKELRACGHRDNQPARALAEICRQEVELARVKDLLDQAGKYVLDDLEAHEHSDGRQLLVAIQSALRANGSKTND